jgi:hypothetical protein
MAKLILLSIVLVSVAVPIRMSSRGSPRRALRSAQWITFAFVFLWAFMCIWWYPELVPVE